MSRRMRLLSATVICCLPWNTSVSTWLSATHYYLFMILALISLVDMDRTKHSSRVITLLFVCVSCLSSPIALLLLPVWAFRIWEQRRVRGFTFYLSWSCLLLIATHIVLIAIQLGGKETVMMVNRFRYVLEFTTKFTGYNILRNIVGQKYVLGLEDHPWVVQGTSVVFLAILVCYLWRQAKTGSPHVADIVLPYILIALPILLCFTRGKLVYSIVELNTYHAANRFSIVPSFILVILVMRMAYVIMEKHRVGTHNFLAKPSHTHKPDGPVKRAKVFTATLLVLGVGYSSVVFTNISNPPKRDCSWSYHVARYYGELLSAESDSAGSQYTFPMPGPVNGFNLPVFVLDEDQRRRIEALPLSRR